MQPMQKLFAKEFNYSKSNKNKWDQTQFLNKFDTLHIQIKTLKTQHPCHVLRARVVVPLLYFFFTSCSVTSSRVLFPHQLGCLAEDYWSVISFNDVIILIIY